MGDIIELSDLSELDFAGRNTSSMKSANFGGGLELLMNDKVKESSRQTTEIDLDPKWNFCEIIKIYIIGFTF